MFNTLLSLGLKFSGFGWIWDKIDGYKTSIAGFSALLHASAAFVLVIAGVVDQAAPLLAAHNLGALVHFAQGLSAFGGNPAVIAFAAAWAKFYGGLGIVGIGHKIDKANSDDPAILQDAKTVQESAANALKAAGG